MPYTNPEDIRAARRRHYVKHRERVIRENAVVSARRRREIQDWIDELKESAPCLDCGKSFPARVMDFDHTSDDKEAGISDLIRRGCGRERIQLEIDKCEIVCANCHRIRTHERRLKESNLP